MGRLSDLADAPGDCRLDGLRFRVDAACPRPQVGVEDYCAGCDPLDKQEACLGVCSKECVWTDHTKLEGDFCELRYPIIEEESMTATYIGIGIASFFGLLILIAAA